MPPVELGRADLELAEYGMHLAMLPSWIDSVTLEEFREISAPPTIEPDFPSCEVHWSDDAPMSHADFKALAAETHVGAPADCAADLEKHLAGGWLEFLGEPPAPGAPRLIRCVLCAELGTLHSFEIRADAGGFKVKAVRAQ